jgi:hypothetical protein
MAKDKKVKPKPKPKKACSPNKVMRKSYVKSNGTEVRASCVMKTRTQPKGTAEKILRERKESERKAMASLRKSGAKVPSKCPAGEILRSAYTRKSGTVVAPSCIKDRGAPGKGKPLIVLNPSDTSLSDEGYGGKDTPIKSLTEMERHRRLMKVVRSTALQHKSNRLGYISTIKKLTTLSTLSKRTDPELSKKVKSDQEYLSKRYSEYLNKNK